MSKPCLMIPNEPDFSPADVAQLLHRSEAQVSYWLISGKLGGRLTFRGKYRITRPELVRFCQEYLQIQITG